MVGHVVSLWLDWNGHKAETARLRTLSPALSLLEAQASGRHQPLDLQVPCVAVRAADTVGVMGTVSVLGAVTVVDTVRKVRSGPFAGEGP